MKLIFNLKSFFAVITLMVILTAKINAQDCPPNGIPWTSHLAAVNLALLGPGAEVQYQTRTVGSDIEITVNWTSFVNFNGLIVNDEAMKKLLIERMVEEAAPCNPNAPTYVKIYSTTDCKATLKTVVEMDRDYAIECEDEGYNAQAYLETFTDANNQLHIIKRFYSTVVCGTKCCATIYTVNCSFDSGTLKFVKTIDNKVVTNISNCSGPSAFTDCLTGDPIPCVEASCGN